MSMRRRALPASAHPRPARFSSQNLLPVPDEFLFPSLLPRDLSLGWADLRGIMRFSHARGDATHIAHLRAFIEGAGFRIVDGDVGAVKLQALRYSHAAIAHVTAQPFRIEWIRSRVNARTRYLFVFINRGSIEFDGVGEHWSNSRGGLGIIFPGATPVTLTAPEGCEAVFFSFDQREIDPLTLTAASLRDVPPTSAVLRAAYAYLQAAVQVPAGPRTNHSDEDDCPAALRTLTKDVARALVLTSQSLDAEKLLVERAKAHILASYRDPHFSTERLAQLCDVSRRTLERAFQSSGLRVLQEIRRQRVQHAMSIVAMDPPLPLDVVAAVSGFGSRSAMSRSFLDVYGVSPSAARRMHLTVDTEHEAVAS